MSYKQKGKNQCFSNFFKGISHRVYICVCVWMGESKCKRTSSHRFCCCCCCSKVEKCRSVCAWNAGRTGLASGQSKNKKKIKIIQKKNRSDTSFLRRSVLRSGIVSPRLRQNVIWINLLG